MELGDYYLITGIGHLAPLAVCFWAKCGDKASESIRNRNSAALEAEAWAGFLPAVTSITAPAGLNGCSSSTEIHVAIHQWIPRHVQS